MSDITRRKALGALALTGAAAAAGTISADVTQRPSNVKVGPVPGPPAKRVLTPSDVVVEGYAHFPMALDTLWWTYGQIAIRRVGGQMRLFLVGDPVGVPGKGSDYPLTEWILPDTLGNSAANATLATPVVNYGLITTTVLDTGGSLGALIGGIHWDEARGGLWLAYKDVYAPVDSHPTQVFIKIDDKTGTMTFYGPWRTEWHSQKTGGGHTFIPQSFVDKYLGGGSNLAIMAGSHNAESPFGANLSRLRMGDPFTTPKDVSLSGHVTIPNDGLILHDINHRMKRDTRYKVCEWTVGYDCSKGSTITPGVPLFGGRVGGSDHDGMGSVRWIDLPDKHGLLYFGQLATTPVGVKAPGDPDGIGHIWYGAAQSTANPEGKPQFCCHGQGDPWWNATGPGAFYRQATGWIYNPDDLIATAQKKVNLWELSPSTDAFNWGDIIPEAQGPTKPGLFGGSAFDDASRRIYLVLNSMDGSRGERERKRPVVVVMRVK